MAQVQYDGGVPEVAPQVQTPDDYQHLQTDSAQFGGAIAQGLQQFGQGASKAAAFFGQAAADNATNQYQDTVTKLMHGDPNKMVPGPDGQMVPDTGYLGLKGRAALDARPQVSSALDETLKNIRAGLQTPEQQLQFDNFSRRYRSMAEGQMGEHADTQANNWYKQVNTDTATLAIGHIAANADNPELVANGTADLVNARVKDAELNGAVKGDSVWNAAVATGKRDALAAQVSAIGVKDPARAIEILDQNKEIAGVQYDNLANSLRARADQQIGEQAGAQAVKSATEGGHVRANYANSSNMGNPEEPGWKEANIVPIDVGGHSLEVNKQAAPAFQGFLQDLTAAGYTIKTVGGYANRDKVGGASGLSQHAYGNAIDVNENINKQGQGNTDFGTIDVGALAAKHGLIWGGNWSGKTKDPMHFEWAGPNGTGGGRNQQVAQNQLTGNAAPTGDATQLIKGFEGFRTKSYWDVDHSRVGYGSDTVTQADGTVVPVTAGTVITQADADRDLARRTQQTQTQVKTAMGEDTWNKLSPNAQASVTSLAYNYGHLPANVAAAAQTGDPTVLAQSILSLAGADGGINAKRRTAEANNVLGKYAGPPTPAGNTPTPPNGQQVASAGPMTPDQLPPPGGNIQAPAPPTQQAVPFQEAQNAGSLKADAYQRIMDDPALANNPQARAHALTYVNQTLQAQAIAAESDQRAKKAANDQAADGYVQRILKGDSDGLVEAITNDPHLTFETRHALGEAAMKQSGNDVKEATQTYGPGFWDAYKKVTLPPGDPNRISDPTELLQRAGPNGDLTLAGATRLTQTLREGQKSVDDQAVNTTRASLLSYAKSKLSFEEDTGPIKIRDPKGEAMFAGQFIPKFMAAYDTWQKEGKNPWEFLTQANVDKMITGMRSSSQMAQDRMTALGEVTGQTPEPANAPLPPPPANADPKAWNTIISKPPTSDTGAPFPHVAWAAALNLLLSNPTPQTIQMFNTSKYGRAGFDANDLLKQLRPPEPGSVPAPAPAPVHPPVTKGYPR